MTTQHRKSRRLVETFGYLFGERFVMTTTIVMLLVVGVVCTQHIYKHDVVGNDLFENMYHRLTLSISDGELFVMCIHGCGLNFKMY